jgi:hypothetical protein
VDSGASIGGCFLSEAEATCRLLFKSLRYTT